jgi:chemotaxis protein histidine kinase CheA
MEDNALTESEEQEQEQALVLTPVESARRAQEEATAALETAKKEIAAAHKAAKNAEGSGTAEEQVRLSEKSAQAAEALARAQQEASEADAALKAAKEEARKQARAARREKLEAPFIKGWQYTKDSASKVGLTITRSFNWLANKLTPSPTTTQKATAGAKSAWNGLKSFGNTVLNWIKSLGIIVLSFVAGLASWLAAPIDGFINVCAKGVQHCKDKAAAQAEAEAIVPATDVPAANDDVEVADAAVAVGANQATLLNLQAGQQARDASLAAEMAADGAERATPTSPRATV